MPGTRVACRGKREYVEDRRVGEGSVDVAEECQEGGLAVGLGSDRCRNRRCKSSTGQSLFLCRMFAFLLLYIICIIPVRI